MQFMTCLRLSSFSLPSYVVGVPPCAPTSRSWTPGSVWTALNVAVQVDALAGHTGTRCRFPRLKFSASRPRRSSYNPSASVAEVTSVDVGVTR
ncbi:hypothetical protein BD311DRAFT_764091 [Dichomitus squalens]|uniref:Secreted protein n=1 Tax=Dichomitus squalens TaxID=114155 RepID=A0A4Q9MHL2_9APHY|nr:hypothetical protein BD311DRAFT_764091 [Dichomitus squalens]